MSKVVVAGVRVKFSGCSVDEAVEITTFLVDKKR